MNCIFVNTINFLHVEHGAVPIGQLSLATIVNNSNNHKAKVIELNEVFHKGYIPLSSLLVDNIINTAKFIMEYNPDFISLYSMCSTHYYALLIADQIKKIKPDTVVALGGPHASITAVKTLEKYPQVDMIGICEGENSILDIIEAAANSDFSKCPGIAYRGMEGVVLNPACDLIQNLDNLPVIDYSLLNYDISGMKGFPIDVGRGCPYDCTFCSTSIFWKRKYRVKSAQRIFKEMSELSKKYNINSFRFEHDIFVINQALVYSLCNLIKESSQKFIWTCSSRIDTIDEELIKEMSSAGCKKIFFGIESGSQLIQTKIKKNLDLNLLYKLLPIMDKYNIIPFFSFMYGFPDETEQTLEETLVTMHNIFAYYEKQFLKTIEIDLHRLMIFPGTEIFENARHLLVKDNYAHIMAQNGYNNWQDTNCLMDDDIDIFSQNYMIDGDFYKKTYFLELFYQSIYRCLKLYFNKTFSLLWDYYKSYLGFYFAFMKIVDTNIIEAVEFKSGQVYPQLKKCIGLLSFFINKVHFGDENLEINDTFNHKYSMLKALFINTRQYILQNTVLKEGD